MLIFPTEHSAILVLVLLPIAIKNQIWPVSLIDFLLQFCLKFDIFLVQASNFSGLKS
jgi:hypothetical protein